MIQEFKAFRETSPIAKGDPLRRVARGSAAPCTEVSLTRSRASVTVRDVMAATLTFAAVVVFPTASAASDDAATPGADRAAGMDRARGALEKWVDVRRTISKERADAVLRRETLDDRIALVEGEIAELRARIAATTAQVDETEGSRAALERENETLKAAAARLVDAVVVLEGRTRALLERGPDPIREKVAPLAQRIPAADAAPATSGSLSLGERYQNVIGILNEINRFNSEVTTRNEVREIAEGTSAEVSAVYLGLGHGFFVTTTGQSAGVGSVVDGRWSWRALDEAPIAISEVMAILRNEQPASFVRVPVEIAEAP